jgi:hypothetical protein
MFDSTGKLWINGRNLQASVSKTYQDPVNFYNNMRIKLKTKFMEVRSKVDVHRLLYYRERTLGRLV